MVQHLKLLLVKSASNRGGSVQVLTTPLLSQLSANIPGKAAEDVPVTRDPVTRMRD